jgi:callose synthase
LTLGKIGFQMEQEKRVMEEDAKKIKEFKSYNILPLETPGVPNPFVFFPEVRK